MTLTPSSTDFVISGGPQARIELVFIEDNVPDATLLADSMRAQGREVVMLDAAHDGLATIATALQGRTDIAALHLVTHGGAGWIDLGSTRLDAAALATRQGELEAIGKHLATDADILLYGCDVAADSEGKSFMRHLAAATGADVAASDDLTGAARLGGDWTLEVHTGDVDAQPAVDAALAGLYDHVLALNNVTADFSMATISNPGGYDLASQDAKARVNNNAAYELVVNGATDGTYAYGAAGRVEVSDNNNETAVNFTFTGGQMFSLDSLDLGNFSANAQKLVFTSYAPNGDALTAAIADLGGASSTTFNFPDNGGFDNISRLKLTATSNGNEIEYLSLDNMVFSTIQASDTTRPTVTGITSSTANGSYTAGDVIAIQVNFSEAVNVSTAGGTPQLTLETGTTDRLVSYSSGSGTSTLTFNYTVQEGDNATDLDYASTGALAANGGSIGDAAHNSANLALPAPGGAGSLGANKALVINTAPVVTNVTSSSDNGTYRPGGGAVSGEVLVQVAFSEVVNVTGTPLLRLETGSTDRNASYVSGSGTNTLTFKYSVSTDDSSTDLDYTGTGALMLNAGTIKDAMGTDATLTLPAPGGAGSLGFNKDIMVDGVRPSVTNVASTAGSGPFKAGDVIPIQVSFDETVVVQATPQLTLETGTVDRVVNYASGSGTNTLTFNYTVQAGDSSADLDYASTGALVRNDGAITDVHGNEAAIIVLPAPGAAGSLGANNAIVVDTLGPAVTSLGSSTAAGRYNAGDTISIQVNFDENVTVDTTGGTPQLTLETGDTDRTVNYVSGSGSTTLNFSYTVQAGDTSIDLDALSTTALAANGATLRDALGNNAPLTLPSPGAAGSLTANEDIVIDTTAPVVTNVTSSTPNGFYTVGTVIPVEVTFSEPVDVTGLPQIKLETFADVQVNYTSGSGTNTLVFNYTVKADDTTPDLDYWGPSSLSLNFGSIRDAAGNNATLGLPAPGTAGSLGANKNIVIDTSAMGMTSVSSLVTNASYKVGAVIPIRFNFGEPMVVDLTGGTPQLTLETGVVDRVIDLDPLSANPSGSNTLVFNYTVQAGDTSADLDYVASSPFSLNGATIRDRAGNDAPINLWAPGTGASLGVMKNIVIDTTAPTLVGVTSSNADGAYKAGDVIAIDLEFSETMHVTGSPQLTLETGGTDRVATFFGGGATKILTFHYTVQPGDTAADLDYLGTAALDLKGGRINDTAANDLASLTLAEPGTAGSISDDQAIVIDTTAPVVTGVTSSPASGTFKVGDIIGISVTLSEDIGVTGTHQLTLETGGTDRVVDFVGVADGNTLTFNYTVQAGDTSADLDFAGTGALAFNNGTITDDAGNAATLTLPTPGAAGSLGANSALVIDGIAPTVSGVTSSTADGRYNAGDVIAIQVDFSEAVTVAGGTPQLTLETGGTDRVVAYAGGSGTSTLTFTCTVQPGDTSADLDFAGSGALSGNGATIRDAAGNDASLTLVMPGAAGSLGANKAIVIDTTAPTVTGFASVSGIYKLGDIVPIAVDLSESVTVEGFPGLPQLTLETGDTDRAVAYTGLQNGNRLVFNYTVQAGDTSGDLDVAAADALTLNGWAVVDAAGNNATLTLPTGLDANSLASTFDVVVDGPCPPSPACPPPRRIARTGSARRSRSRSPSAKP